jgi:CRP/FNR family transcriptional regulator, cyclic AMP receptor protein
MKLQQVMFEAGDVIVEPGQACKGAFLIEDGKVEVFRSSGGRTIVVASLGKGEIFGEVALVGGSEHVRYVQARERTSCLVISVEQYQALIEDTPPIMRLFLARVVRKLRRTTDLAFGK